MKRRTRADYEDDGWIFYGHGSTHDLAQDDSDPRNPKLAGLKSVSYAAAVAMRRDEPAEEPAPMGFHIPAPQPQLRGACPYCGDDFTRPQFIAHAEACYERTRGKAG